MTTGPDHFRPTRCAPLHPAEVFLGAVLPAALLVGILLAGLVAWLSRVSLAPAVAIAPAAHAQPELGDVADHYAHALSTLEGIGAPSDDRIVEGSVMDAFTCPPGGALSARLRLQSLVPDDPTGRAHLPVLCYRDAEIHVYHSGHRGAGPFEVEIHRSGYVERLRPNLFSDFSAAARAGVAAIDAGAPFRAGGFPRGQGLPSRK